MKSPEFPGIAAPSGLPAVCALRRAGAAVFCLLALAGCSAAGGEGVPGDFGRSSETPSGATSSGGGAGGAEPSADPPQGGEQDLCDNGLDDDGDGAIDEGCPCVPGVTQPCFSGSASRAGKGACTMGKQLCSEVQGSGEFAQYGWGACVGSGTPAGEQCDGVDNDCDGDVDPGCACEEGATLDCSNACGPGQQVCTGGAWSGCNAKQPSAEVCDGKDNDCNGKTDENLTQPCSSACGTGKKYCVYGVWGFCDAPSSCTEPCGTVVCKGTCCPVGTACCSNGACPDAKGQCPSVCNTVVCEGACCPLGTQCCKNGACPDPLTGTCSSELDQCAGKPAVEVFAHSGMTLYRINPDTKAISSVGLFSGCSGQVIDIAMDKDGVMYGATASAIYRINKVTAGCTLLSAGSGYPNALSFVPAGTVFPDKEALVGYSGGTYVVIDPDTGKMTSKSSLPAGYSSSGDVVSVAGVGTFLSVTGNGCADCLLKVNPTTGQMVQKLGNLGYGGVYGLAFWKGVFYGFTNPGALFTFDPATLQAQTVNANTGFHFNGAGSSTCAPQL